MDGGKKIERVVYVLVAVVLVRGASVTARAEDGRLLNVAATCTHGTLDDGAELRVDVVLPDGAVLPAEELDCSVLLRKPGEDSYQPYDGELAQLAFAMREVAPPYIPNDDIDADYQVRARLRHVLTASFEAETCDGRRFAELEFMEIELVLEAQGQSPIVFTGEQRIDQVYACGPGASLYALLGAGVLVIVGSVVVLTNLLIRRARRNRSRLARAGAI